jgi:hypothetical protein
VTAFIDDMTWPCMVCGEERPDAAISVYTEDFGETGDGHVPMSVNIRYCNDRPACAGGAKEHQLLTTARSMYPEERPDDRDPD